MGNESLIEKKNSHFADYLEKLRTNSSNEIDS